MKLTDEQIKECEDNSCAEGMGRYADSLCDPLKQRISELEEQRDMLLRCLENDYGIKASWDGLRKLWLTESATPKLDYVEDKSRWFNLFGTPARAARTMIDTFAACEGPQCTTGKCPFRQLQHGCSDYGIYGELLEWLLGDS